MKTKFNQSGFTLVGALISAVIVVISATALSRAFFSNRTMSVIVRDRQLAEAYATETLELFRAMSGSQILAYMSQNPNAGAPFLMCAHINLLNRLGSTTTLKKYLNQDLNVDLGSTPLDGATADLSANRFYTIQVVDISTAPPIFQTGAPPATKNYCDVPFNAYTPGAPTERLFVTVGVSWVPFGRTATTPERVALSELIPTW